MTSANIVRVLATGNPVVDEFEPFKGGVAVHLPGGDLVHIKTPEGFTDTAFRGTLAAFDTAYRRNGKIPSVGEIHELWPKLPKKTIGGVMSTLEFRAALNQRGIQWDPKDGLSMEQQTVLLKLSDPFDRRGLASKLKDLGVPMAKFQGWAKQPLFKELYEQHTKANYEEALPAIRQRLIGNAEAGDQRAIELVFAMTGEWNPNQQHLEDARTIVLKVVEAIIKHVKDVKTREAILSDVSMYAGTMASMAQQKTLE
jgi:hypothetical protein